MTNPQQYEETLSPDDLALLRRFEPILAFNRGEQFYPMGVDRYLAASQLCVRRPNEFPEVLVPRGQLNAATLTVNRPEPPGAQLYVHFVDPLPPKEVQAFRSTSTLRDWNGGRGRLARVGILARLADLVFSLTLLVRGRTPGGSAAAASLAFQQMQAAGEPFTYYARVVRAHGYTALQYWFFYAFNDWRSSFNGVNDHEADWEQITVYVTERDGDATPVWLAYSSHEFSGDDLRRRWDDPDLVRDGEHPVVFVAAGAHANYFFPGEYLPTVALPYTQWIIPIWAAVQRFWQVTLRQGGELNLRALEGLIRIPFVDYARGDGLRVGPGTGHNWQLRALQATADAPAPPWVDGFRGLWGRYTGDLLEGEDAPARPKYHRNGAVLQMWHDPVGWSGLDHVPPPDRALATLLGQAKQLDREQQTLTDKIEETADRLTLLEAELFATRELPHMRLRTIETQRTLRSTSTEIARLKQRHAANAETLAQIPAAAARLANGDYGSPRAHLRVPQLPASQDEVELSRWAELWSALSIGLLLVCTVALAIMFRNRWEISLLALIAIYAFVEALFRRQVQVLVRSVCVGLALLALGVLLIQFFWPVMAAIALISGVVIMIENVRELRR